MIYEMCYPLIGSPGFCTVLSIMGLGKGVGSVTTYQVPSNSLEARFLFSGSLTILALDPIPCVLLELRVLILPYFSF